MSAGAGADRQQPGYFLRQQSKAWGHLIDMYTESPDVYGVRSQMAVKSSTCDCKLKETLAGVQASMSYISLLTYKERTTVPLAVRQIPCESTHYAYLCV